ncbi:hypothetical protein IE53DRAFT_389180 [Violaceomyces palustris]|uniref:Uncharacterized protein n=1 Tax=Violaceomyces palustris TaxID=1673888 RepID=A0ACD0NRX6_9BASI|nr:hypothetical protein IE53DRAFT_389180 [Violaceomyces palustris]
MRASTTLHRPASLLFPTISIDSSQQWRIKARGHQAIPKHPSSLPTPLPPPPLSLPSSSSTSSSSSSLSSSSPTSPFRSSRPPPSISAYHSLSSTLPPFLIPSISSNQPRGSIRASNRSFSSSPCSSSSSSSFPTPLSSSPLSSRRASSQPSRFKTSLSHFFDPSSPSRPSRCDHLYRDDEEDQDVFSEPLAFQLGVKRFLGCIQEGRVKELRQVYPELVRTYEEYHQHLSSRFHRLDLPPPPRNSRHQLGFKKSDLLEAIKLTLMINRDKGRSSKPLTESGYRFIRTIFYDMERVFGFRHDSLDLHYLLWSRVSLDKREPSYYDPYLVLRHMREEFQWWKTASADWNLVISALIRQGNTTQAKRAYQAMAEQGVEPNKHLINTMISLHFSEGSHTEVKELGKELGGYQTFDIDTLSIFLEGFSKALTVSSLESERQSFRDEARRVATYLEEKLPGCQDQVAWNSFLRYSGIIAGPEAAMETARKALSKGFFRGNARTFNVLLLLHEKEMANLNHSDEAVELLQRLEAMDPSQTLKADKFSYTILINALLGFKTSGGGKTSSTLLVISEKSKAKDVSASASDPTEEMEGSKSCAKSSMSESPNFSNPQPPPSSKESPPPLPSLYQIREAQNLYDHVRRIGMDPDAAMVYPLILAYADSFLPDVKACLRLVEDLMEARGKGDLTSDKESSGPSSLDLPICNAILRGCCKSRDLDSARSMLRLMKANGLKISSSSKVGIATSLIKASNGWKESFEMYRMVGSLKRGNSESNVGYDAHGYRTLLDTFMKLAFKGGEDLEDLEWIGLDNHEGRSRWSLGSRRSRTRNVSGFPSSCRPSSSAALTYYEDDFDSHLDGVAPPDLLMALLRDMLESGHRPTAVTYTSLLDYYGKSGKASFRGVFATHELLKLDEELEPDLALINALMNAYNRAGAPGPVLSIWQSLVTSRVPPDSATLSILLDTCGRSGMLSFARKAIASVRRLEGEMERTRRRTRRSGSSCGDRDKTIDGDSEEGMGEGVKSTAMNKRAWDAWIECLARCGRLEEAIEAVFGSMRSEILKQHGHPPPTSPSPQGTETVENSSTPSNWIQTIRPILDDRGDIVGPDKKTLQTLLKFAAHERDGGTSRPNDEGTSSSTRDRSLASSCWHEIRRRVREEMPWLWKDVKDVGLKRGGWDDG